MTPRIALVLFLLVAPVRQETFTVPTAVAEHRLVKMSATGLKWVVWLVEPASRVDLEASQSGDEAVWVAPPGVYVVNAVGLGPDDLPREYRASVTIGSAVPVDPTPVPPHPTPGPTPPKPTPTPPTPTPNPPHPTPTPPATGTLHVTLFLGDESLAYLRTDPALRASLVASDCVYRSYMISEPEAKPYAPIIAACGGSPCVVLQDSTGRVLSCCRVANAATITACVAEVRKGK